jgi:adenylate cyclase class 2
MLLEVELKFPLADPAAVRQSLVSLGAIFSDPIEQADVYFAHPSRDFRRTDEALRIRRVGSDNFVTYKGPKLDAETKTRQEIELPLAPGEEGFSQFAALLEVLGFRRVYEVRKERLPGEILFGGQQIQLALDHVASLGDFLEIELLADYSDLTESKRCLASLAADLGLTSQERRGYLDLLLSLGGVNH